MRKLFVTILSLLALTAAAGQGVPQTAVTWHELGPDENASMPIGNGDIAVNAWTEPQGDLVMLIAKNDAWSENALLYKVSRVRVQLSPTPFAGEPDFAQTLTISDARIQLKSARGELSLWVDANSPLIHVDVEAAEPVSMTVRHEPWRTRSYHMTQEQLNRSVFNYWEWRSNPGGIDFLADTVLAASTLPVRGGRPGGGQRRDAPAEQGVIGVCHFNAHSMYPVVLEREHLGELIGKYADPLLHRCFGIVTTGRGLAAADDLTLCSSQPARRQQATIGVLCEQTESVDQWLSDAKRLTGGQRGPRGPQQGGGAWEAHTRWWQQFWQRSWVEVDGSDEARRVSEGYAMNRYMTAICSRGQYPVKFNGSLLTVGHDVVTPDGDAAEQMAAQTLAHHDPDYRDWGSCFWNQNIRHTYYPLAAQGDYDLLMPWLNMYTDALPLAQDRTRLYYGHGGASFIETIHFFGLPNLMDFGWDNPGCDPQSGYMKWHVQGALEIIITMLDYYDNTQDIDYLQRKLLPFAQAILTYYNEHWQRGQDGKIHLDPHQSIEMYQTDCADPTPDIAGLGAVTSRLLAVLAQPLGTHDDAQLMGSEVSAASGVRQLCLTLQRDLPAIPVGRTQQGKLPLRADSGDADGLPVILPAWRYGDPSNGENPELYSVFPYRNYCLGKPDLELALNTYHARRYPFNNCWGQDGMEAALLGLTDDARAAAVSAFTCYGTQKFPWFWRKVADYSPDMDNGGTGAMTLQLMLMQCQGREIRLLPAWPQQWTADFRLHAPFETTVEGRVEQGRIVSLKVTPESRRRDVIMP